MVGLSVKIGKLKLKNPVMSASGTFGLEYGELVDIDRLGALVLKTITLEERKGNPSPRIAETCSGMLNSIGLENKGLRDFIKNKIPQLKKMRTAIIASIAGSEEKEYAALAKTLGRTDPIAAIELNLSCPNVRHGSREGLIAQDEEATHSIVKAARKVTSLPLIAKLSPNVADIVKIALAAQRGGADAVLLVNTFPAMAVDSDNGRPRLGNITGGLSGPAIKPIALKMVWDAYNKIDIPIIGCGGIMDHKDALEFMLCGAVAVQIGTATFVNPCAAIEVVDGIARYMRKNRIDNAGKIVGTLRAGAL